VGVTNLNSGVLQPRLDWNIQGPPFIRKYAGCAIVR
jgi:hypothetical protein